MKSVQNRLFYSALSLTIFVLIAFNLRAQNIGSEYLLKTWRAYWIADIKVSGKRDGFLKVNDARLFLEKIGSGTIEAKLGDYEIKVDLAKGLPTGVPGELR